MLTLPGDPLLSNAQTINQFTWSFNSGAQNFNYLANNERLTLTYTIQLSDGIQGSTPATHDIVIHIDGTNDDPSITAGDVTGDISEAGTLSDSGSITFNDVDLTNLSLIHI